MCKQLSDMVYILGFPNRPLWKGRVHDKLAKEMNLMFDARMKDDVRIAAPYLAPSPPAQCCSTLRAARCRVTLPSYSHLPLFPSFPSQLFFGVGGEVSRGSKVTGFVSERKRGGERQGGAGSLWCESLVLQQPAAPLLCRRDPHHTLAAVGLLSM